MKPEVKKAIKKYEKIKSHILNADCPLCQKYRNNNSCNNCPIKTPKGCSDNFYKIVDSINEFIKELNSLSS